MDSMIKETNDNLKAIIEGLKSSLDTSASTLENIQLQMDKKVEEAKKYKISVDSAKESIKKYEEENRSLEISLKELSDTYGKLNLVSVIEAGNREIKTKINDNLREIAKQKEHIADLTNKARTIKDLLINMKKDKTIKGERLDNLKVIYEYYNDRINDVIDYAFNHSNTLMEYKSVSYDKSYVEPNIDENLNTNSELENTMVFDEIANIDDNKNFKDEMTFISSQIDDNIDVNKDEKIRDIINNSMVDEEVNKGENDTLFNSEEVDKEVEDSTNVFNSILDNDESEQDGEGNTSHGIAEKLEEDVENDSSVNEKSVVLEPTENKENTIKEEDFNIADNMKEETFELDPVENRDTIKEEKENENNVVSKENVIDDTRINKLNDLFSSIEENKGSEVVTPIIPTISNNIEKKIDDAYLDIFSKPIDEKIETNDNGLTDIFGNIIKEDNINRVDTPNKKIEELFTENGIDFNKFKEDEQTYLKDIYSEEKFTSIIKTLQRNNINLDNLYYSFNIFGEINPKELESIIYKLLNVGQSVDAIGMILEKLPKVKKYNLDEAIESYGEYIKNVDITELIMKAKELYKNGGNN